MSIPARISWRDDGDHFGARSLLIAGRAIDADRGGCSAARVMVTDNQTGEAAGAAVYLALMGEIDPTAWRETLRAQGAIVR